MAAATECKGSIYRRNNAVLDRHVPGTAHGVKVQVRREVKEDDKVLRYR